MKTALSQESYDSSKVVNSSYNKVQVMNFNIVSPIVSKNSRLKVVSYHLGVKALLKLQ